MVFMTWGNLEYARKNSGGNDFLVHWIGTRSFLIDGTSPYSDDTALRIQTAAYGRPAKAGEHELRVAYPLYSIIIFLPFALFSDFSIARALWMTFLEAGLVLLALLSLRQAGWKPNLFSLVIFLFFSLTWYHAVRPLINGNVVILVALGIVGALEAIRHDADELAGILLAFTTIKPQVVVVFIVFIIFWSLYNRRWRLIAWLLGTVAILVAVAVFFQQDWILQNIREVMRYPGYNPPGTPGSALATWFPAMGERFGLAMSAVMGIILLFEWFRNRKASGRGFLWLAYLTLVVSQWIGIQTDPGNFIVTFPALVLCLALLQERWRRGGWVVSFVVMLVVLIGVWVIFLQTMEMGSQPLQSPIMFFPLPGLLLLLLYWVRWQAFREPDLLFDAMDSSRRRI